MHEALECHDRGFAFQMTLSSESFDFHSVSFSWGKKKTCESEKKFSWQFSFILDVKIQL